MTDRTEQIRKVEMLSEERKSKPLINNCSDCAEKECEIAEWNELVRNTYDKGRQEMRDEIREWLHTHKCYKYIDSEVGFIDFNEFDAKFGDGK